MLKILNYKSDIKEIKHNNFSSETYYLYTDKKNNSVICCDDLKELINSNLIPKKLEIEKEAIFHLFTTSIVPPPLTVYKNLFKVGQGLKANIKIIDKKLDINFLENKNNNKNENEKNSFSNDDEHFILEKLFSYIQKNKMEGKPNYLFQSSGKDSNMIALSYSLFGKSKDLTCLTYNNNDEFYYANKISKKLGIKHIMLEIPDIKKNIFEVKSSEYFKKLFFPNTDNAFLGYFLYNDGMLNRECNLIDGMGNDIYIGHIPKRYEFTMQFLSNFLSKFNFITKHTGSLIINELFKKKIFWPGLVGLPTYVNKKILKDYKDITKFYDNKYEKDDNYFDIRSKIRGRYVDLEKFIMKLQCHAQATNSKAIFPWTDDSLSNYFINLDKKFLYSKKNLKNKLILRNILEKRLDINFDNIGKKDFKFDFWKIMLWNKIFVKETILNSNIFSNKKYLLSYLDHLFIMASRKGITSNRCKILLNQIFQICLWYNNSEYIKK